MSNAIGASTRLVTLSNAAVPRDALVATGGSQTRLEQGTRADPAVLKAVGDSQQKANTQIATALNRMEARLDKYDKERSGYLDALKEAKPVSMKMTQAEWTDFTARKTERMAFWTNGAGDVGGINANEDKWLKAIDKALSGNAMYLTHGEANAMLAAADANGMQQDKRNWENHLGLKVFNAIAGHADGARQTYKQDVSAWQQRQNVANAGLGNVTTMLGSSQQAVTGTLPLLKSMNLGEASAAFSQSLLQQVKPPQPTALNTRSNDEEEQRRSTAPQNVRVRLSIDSPQLQPLARLGVNLNLNLNLSYA